MYRSDSRLIINKGKKIFSQKLEIIFFYLLHVIVFKKIRIKMKDYKNSN